MPRVAVYVSCADSGEIRVLGLDEATGSLEPMQTVALGGTLMPMALSPDRRRLFVGRRSEPLAAITLAVDAGTGRLDLVGEGPLPASMAHLATDATGRWLFGASYGDGLVSVSPIDAASGRVGPVNQMLPAGPNAHALRSTPDNRFAFATSLGSDRVLQFRFDATTGLLSANEPAALSVHAGAGPRHLAFHPRLPRVYLVDELDASLVVFALGEAGTLAPLQTVEMLPRGFAGSPWAAELRLTPDGAFLYASERRSSTISAFAVDAHSGLLGGIGRYPTQAQPRGFAVAPAGRHLVVAGQASHKLGVHAIDPRDGTLAALGEAAVGGNPNWVEMLAMA